MNTDTDTTKTKPVELFEKFVTENKENLHIDSIMKSVMGKFIQRSQVGFQKYGTDLDRTDLSFPDWIQHAQEELMDGILYLEKLKRSAIEEKPL
jgi:hypothetical protein